MGGNVNINSVDGSQESKSVIPVLGRLPVMQPFSDTVSMQQQLTESMFSPHNVASELHQVQGLPIEDV